MGNRPGKLLDREEGRRMLTRAQRGVSLIELMIGIAIVSMLLMMGVPAFSLWLQNLQVRTAAESVQNGLQKARTEAIRRNVNVRFVLNDANGAVAWSVGCETVTTDPDCPATLQSRLAGEGGANARIGVNTAAIPMPIPAGQFSTALAAGAGITAGVSGVTFNSLGRVANVGTAITRIDVTNVATNDARRMVLAISAGGQIRMCDPALSFASNAAGC
ncbi:MAG TPA: GspH/FimT family pseudopilin [Burkholderiaceae bacterium]|nr:GspH/FimT family pseudopilin [Burkholderiaceae bacterium]